MIIESKVIAAVIFSVAAFFLLCGLMVLLGIRNVDKRDRCYVVVSIIISFLIGYSLIIGGIQLLQI